MTAPAPAALTGAAADAARSVGDLLRQGFQDGVATDTKRDFHDLVTAYDRSAEEEIRAVLDARVPGSRIVGEEDGATGDGPVIWYVDPIDGTNNFASGVPFFCVSIGAELDGRLVAGVVYDPIREELFAATPEGATLNDAPIKVRDARPDREAVLGTDFPGHQPSALETAGGTGDFERFGELVRSFRTVRRLGSGALMLAYVAAGRLDVTLGLTTNPWDVAAGALLIEAAGGHYHPLRGPGERDVSAWQTRAYLAYGGGFDLGASSVRGIAGHFDTSG